MVLMVLTASALQNLINKGHTFATQHGIIYNTMKTEYMVIPSKKLKSEQYAMCKD